MFEEGEKAMKKLAKITSSFLVITCCLIFFGGSTLYAAEQWWTVDIDDVIVETSPSVIYTVKVTNPSGPWTRWLTFTDKAMLASALTCRSLPEQALVKFENTTMELLYLAF